MTRQLLLYRDKLVTDRQRIFLLRHKTIGLLTEWDLVLRQTDVSLRTNPPNRNQLLAQRSRALAEIAFAERSKVEFDYALKRTDDELKRVDNELIRYMALK